MDFDAGAAMLSDQGSLAAGLDRLNQIRARHRLRVVLVTMAWCVVLGLFAFAAARGLTVATGAALSGPAAAGGIVAVVAAAGIAFFLLRAPSLLDAARRADARFGLAERMSTALEVLPHGRANPVRLMLLRDAANSAGTIEPRAAVDLRIGPPVLVPLGLVLVASLALLTLTSGMFAAPAGGPSGGRTATDPLGAIDLADPEAAGRVRRLADLIAEDATARRDPYLRAVSDAIVSLTEEQQAEITLDRDLAPLLDHAALAYGDTPPTWLPPATTGVEQMRSGMEAMVRPPPPMGNTEVAAGGAGQGDGASVDGDPTQTAGSTNQPGRSPDAPGGVRLQVGSAPLPGALVDYDDFYAFPEDIVTPEQRAAYLRRMEAQPPNAGGAAMPIGAAQNSTRGGNEGGAGVQPLSDDGAIATIDTPGGGADVLLPSRVNPDGRTIRIEVTPETRSTNVTRAAGGAAAGWQALPEVPQSREMIPAARREVVRRYFEQGREAETP